MTGNPRPASSVKAKVARGVVQMFATLGSMVLAGWLGKKPEYGAVAPLILGPLGGWLRNKYPGYADVVPF